MSQEQNNTMYDQLVNMIENSFQVKEEEKEKTEELGKEEYNKAVRKEILKENTGPIALGVLFALTGAMVLLFFIDFYKFVMLLNTAPVNKNIVALILKMAIPFGVWMASTEYDFYCYWRRKFALLCLCVINLLAQFFYVVSAVIGDIVFQVLVLIPIGGDITIGMVCNLGRLIIVVVECVLMVLLLKAILKGMNSPITRSSINQFKLRKIIPKKSDKYRYDLSIVRNLDTGAWHTIKEKDRYLHMLANGVTGSGKTSTVFMTALSSDMEQISINKEQQKKEVEELLKMKKVRLKYDIADEDYNIAAFEGVDEKGTCQLEKLKLMYPVAGITGIAPDSGFADNIYEMASAHGLKVNRIDPILTEDGYCKPGFKGFNPLYVRQGLDAQEFVIEVGQKAILCADVLQAIFDAEGRSDPYFSGLNKTITTAIAMLLMFTFPSINKGKQPTLVEIQSILNEFSNAEKYLIQLVKLYAKRDEYGRPVYDSGKPIFLLPLHQSIYNIISKELLGEGAEAMMGQCRGLMNIVNTVLTDIRINNVLCCEDSIDIDFELENGGITVLNFALEMGSAGRALGLFYMLSFINSAYRRKGTEDTRIPNFCYVDEFPQILHPSLEQCFVLFRKYRIAMAVAVQSLSQMDRSLSTAFMKPVLIGSCAHHFVFGRASNEEMKLYESLAGKSLKVLNTTQVNETSVTADNPSVSYGHREQMSFENNMEGAEVRNRDFREVTVVTVVDGSPIGIFAGKTFFVPRWKKKYRKKQYEVKWSDYFIKEGNEDEKEIEKEDGARYQKVVTASDRFTEETDYKEQQSVPVFLQEAKRLVKEDEEKARRMAQQNRPSEECDYGSNEVAAENMTHSECKEQSSEKEEENSQEKQRDSFLL